MDRVTKEESDLTNQWLETMLKPQQELENESEE